LFRISEDTQVAADCFFQPNRAERPLLLALHGLESSSDAHYMRGLASQAYRRGWSAVLLNQRNCGGTEHLTPTARTTLVSRPIRWRSSVSSSRSTRSERSASSATHWAATSR
jgi:predicted alpha/beta-fold hydrolase